MNRFRIVSMIRNTLPSKAWRLNTPSIINIQSRHYPHLTLDECDAHMNELPIACGDFKKHYNKTQTTYNMVFLAGLGWFLLSGFLMLFTDSFYLNWAPPCSPEGKEEIEGCCKPPLKKPPHCD